MGTVVERSSSAIDFCSQSLILFYLGHCSQSWGRFCKWGSTVWISHLWSYMPISLVQLWPIWRAKDLCTGKIQAEAGELPQGRDVGGGGRREIWGRGAGGYTLLCDPAYHWPPVCGQYRGKSHGWLVLAFQGFSSHGAWNICLPSGSKYCWEFLRTLEQWTCGPKIVLGLPRTPKGHEWHLLVFSGISVSHLGPSFECKGKPLVCFLGLCYPALKQIASANRS